ncbi:MAG TPA: extracellular solute-binding protein [Jatrophihabitantaceae bacterium]|nr:extracellular solute-binding protein [Jatrophihabitantaceae bacterium]
MTLSRKSLAVVAAAVLALGTAAACSSSKNKSGSSGGASSGAPSANLSGVKYTVLGQWTGAEQAAFQAVINAFDKATGAKGTYTPAAGGDEATVLGTQVNAGHPPDIAMLALPGAISQYAKAGKLQALGSDAEKAVSDNYAKVWTDLATVNGKVYGVPFDASNKSTVWYRAQATADAGLPENGPSTWDDFLKGLKTLNDSGVPVPLSIGGGDGWTLTDWFENVYIRTAGIDNYDKLTHHQIKWTDDTVKTALETLKQLWGDSSLIGSPAAALKVPFTGSVDNTFKNGAKSAVVFEGSFVATTITGDKLPAKVGTDAKFFPFPSVNGSKPVIVGGGDFAVGFTTNKAVQPFLAYLATPEAAKAIVGTAGSGFLSANKNLATGDYSNPTSGELGKQIVDAGDNFRFDMSDQAPAEFGGTPNQGEWADLQTFLRNGNVAAAQASLEKHAAAAKGW